MLDNTILLWSAELANGGHDLFRMMYVVAGGRNLGIRPGRYIKFAESGANPYGDGRAGERIVDIISSVLAGEARTTVDWAGR